LNRLIRENDRFKTAISYLCAFDEDDKLEATTLALLGAWITSEKGVAISSLLNQARKNAPSFLRDEKGELNQKCVNILESIPDFNYWIEKGFLRWSYRNGLDSGVLSYGCSTPQFAKFQKILIRQNPCQYDDLEGVLLS